MVIKFGLWQAMRERLCCDLRIHSKSMLNGAVFKAVGEELDFASRTEE
jgi:hypothetical protein